MILGRLIELPRKGKTKAVCLAVDLAGEFANNKTSFNQFLDSRSRGGV